MEEGLALAVIARRMKGVPYVLCMLVEGIWPSPPHVRINPGQPCSFSAIPTISFWILTEKIVFCMGIVAMDLYI